MQIYTISLFEFNLTKFYQEKRAVSKLARCSGKLSFKQI